MLGLQVMAQVLHLCPGMRMVGLALVFVWLSLARATTGPHRVVVAWVTSMDSCSCDKSDNLTNIGYSEAAYGILGTLVVPHTWEKQKELLAGLAAECVTACAAIP